MQAPAIPPTPTGSSATQAPVSTPTPPRVDAEPRARRLTRVLAAAARRRAGLPRSLERGTAADDAVGGGGGGGGGGGAANGDGSCAGAGAGFGDDGATVETKPAAVAADDEAAAADDATAAAAAAGDVGSKSTAATATADAAEVDDDRGTAGTAHTEITPSTADQLAAFRSEYADLCKAYYGVVPRSKSNELLSSYGMDTMPPVDDELCGRTDTHSASLSRYNQLHITTMMANPLHIRRMTLTDTVIRLPPSHHAPSTASSHLRHIFPLQTPRRRRSSHRPPEPCCGVRDWYGGGVSFLVAPTSVLQ